MATNKNPKRPTHNILQVIGDGERAYWLKVGAAWENADGKGLSLKFDAFPLTGRIVIREIEEDDQTSSAAPATA